MLVPSSPAESTRCVGGSLRSTRPSGMSPTCQTTAAPSHGLSPHLCSRCVGEDEDGGREEGGREGERREEVVWKKYYTY